MSWDRLFENPVPLPDGRVIRTLREAGEFIQALPQARQKAEEWQTACEALMLTVEHKGPTMHARMGFMAALNASKPKPPLAAASSDPHWSRRKLARDAR